jgi:hypothetical protein
VTNLTFEVHRGLGNDLPPKWDGRPVEWEGWRNLETSMALHLPVDDLTCRACGAIGERAINSGKRLRTFRKEQRTKSGAIYLSTQRYRRPVRDLFAFRCRHCGHDQVLDTSTDQLWDLDPSDYSDEGSYELGQGALL